MQIRKPGNRTTASVLQGLCGGSSLKEIKDRPPSRGKRPRDAKLRSLGRQSSVCALAAALGWALRLDVSRRPYLPRPCGGSPPACPAPAATAGGQGARRVPAHLEPPTAAAAAASPRCCPSPQVRTEPRCACREMRDTGTKTCSGSYRYTEIGLAKHLCVCGLPFKCISTSSNVYMYIFIKTHLLWATEQKSKEAQEHKQDSMDRERESVCACTCACVAIFYLHRHIPRLGDRKHK